MPTYDRRRLNAGKKRAISSLWQAAVGCDNAFRGVFEAVNTGELAGVDAQSLLDILQDCRSLIGNFVEMVEAAVAAK